MSFERARRIADAVLLEGYVLYPYRASAAKNRWRWSFGVLAPRAWSEAGGCEAWWLEAQVLLEGRSLPRVRGALRFLQVSRRSVEEAGAGGFRPVEALADGERLHVSFDEGHPREAGFELVAGEAGAEPGAIPFALSGERTEEPILGADGGTRGRLVRTSLDVRGTLLVASEPAGDGLWRVRIRVENQSPWEDLRAPRDEALRASLVSAHLILGVDGGAFVSLVDPPVHARAAASACRNVRTFPVLAGETGERDLLLCAPIILYDHPRVAPESPGDLFDGTEIDEILSLRTATLTDEEQREARGTDPRAAAILDRVAALHPEAWEKLHGAIRDLREAEMVPRLRVGDRVRLRPGARRTDAQDLLYAGRTATVREVKRDVDGRVFLAVTIDGDPAAELHDWYGRYHHYAADEVEPLETGEAQR